MNDFGSRELIGVFGIYLLSVKYNTFILARD